MSSPRVLRFLRKYWRPVGGFVLSIASLIRAVLALARDPGNRVGWVFLALSAVFFTLGLIAFRREQTNRVPFRVSRRTWDYLGPYASWSRLSSGRTEAIYSPELNRRLAAGDAIAVTLEGTWLPEGKAKEHQGFHAARLKRNEAKLRLATDLLPDSSAVTLQQTDYASFLTTNRLAYEEWWDKKHDAPDLTFEQVEPTVRDGALPRLRDSRCSNHLGGDILAVGDGFFLLQLQNAANGMYPDMWLGSASGSFDVGDHAPGRSLPEVVKSGLLRELAEEMGLSPDQVPSFADTKVIGYSRATYMGGKPQFYGVCRLASVTVRPDRYARRFERVTFEGGAEGLIARLERFSDEHHDLLAPPLEMLIKIVAEWLRGDTRAAEWLWPSEPTAPPATAVAEPAREG